MCSPQRARALTLHRRRPARRREGRQQLAEGLRFMTDRLRGSEASRITVLLNPARNPRPPSLLEILLHASVAQQAGRLAAAAKEGGGRGGWLGGWGKGEGGEGEGGEGLMPVAGFLGAILGDAALAERLSQPLMANTRGEIDVVKAFANKVGLG